MKKLVFGLLIFLPGIPGSLQADLRDYMDGPMTRPLQFVEDFYAIYKRSLVEDNISQGQRIRLLHLAAQAPFDYPQRALAACRTEQQYEKYRYLMYFRISFLLTDSYMNWAMQFDKEDIYWMDYRYAVTALKGFRVAKELYESAQYYWYKTVQFARICYARRAIMLTGHDMDSMQEDVHRVIMAEERTRINEYNLTVEPREPYLDYLIGKILQDRLRRLNEKASELCNSPRVQTAYPAAMPICKDVIGVNPTAP